MARNEQFTSSREPLRGRDDIDLRDRPSGPFSFLNPTRAGFGLSDSKLSSLGYNWRSRDNRKGRHALRVSKAGDGTEGLRLPLPTNSPRAILKGILRMFTTFPYWDISWLVAVIFTLGSVVWVINGFFAFLPLVVPSTQFPNEVYIGGGVSAFIGAIIFFETGSILLMFEAINENHAGCFGWALEKLYSESADGATEAASKAVGEIIPMPSSHCDHHHSNKKNFVGRGGALAETAKTYTQDQNSSSDASWQWWPTYASLRDHYVHELGFLASFSQFLGATIFGISGFTALPGIYNHLENSVGLLDGIYWVPQIIGGSGFIISGTLYMLETQEKWWKPALSVLGWHIGFWNLIGAIGFTLCGALGLDPGSPTQYAASLSTFIGSWAFLIGSVVQLYESLDKYPVEGE